MLARLQQCATKRKMSFCPQGWPLFSLRFFWTAGVWKVAQSLCPYTLNKDHPTMTWRQLFVPFISCCGFMWNESHLGWWSKRSHRHQSWFFFFFNVRARMCAFRRCVLSHEVPESCLSNHTDRRSCPLSPSQYKFNVIRLRLVALAWQQIPSIAKALRRQWQDHIDAC